MTSDDPSGPRLDRRKFVLGTAFLGSAAIANARLPRTNQDYLGSRKLEDIIPKKFGEWEFVTASGLVVAPQDQLAQLIYSQLLTRVYYAKDKPPVMLLIAQSASQTGLLQVHRPEFCYTAGGYTLSPVMEHQLALGGLSLPTNRLTATSSEKVEQIVYWTRIGDDLPVSWLGQRLAVAEANLRGIIPDAVLARVSVISSDRDESTRLIDSFSRSMVAAMSPLARKVLVGA